MPQQRILVVTAVHAPAAHFLADAYRSLCEQELPSGWDWQWIIREDGETDEVRPHVPLDERVVFEQGRPGGPGTARNMALACAEGNFVRVLDSDDQLTPGALARDLAVFLREPSVGWTTSRVLDLLPDGETVGFEGDPPEGPVERGEVLEYWRTHKHRAPVHPATLCMRRDLLTALGGWMALPASEDTGLLLALNAVSRGYFIPDVGLLYRKHPGQLTAQETHVDERERTPRMSVIDARAEALGRLGWTYPGQE